jgi:hypothetical protein
LSQANSRLPADAFDSGDFDAEVNTETNPNLGIDEAELMASLSNPEMQVLASPFVGQWNQLVSTTNWEKGRIIAEWREKLIDSGASATVYSDEAWSRTVGGVTSQHVGRLRRVYSKFGETYATYAGLYWSHFLAGLDWDDSPMWLEGAVQSGWSVSQMRAKRWATLGEIEADRPVDSDIVSAETDEDYEPIYETEDDRESKDRIGTSGPLNEGPDFADADDPTPSAAGSKAVDEADLDTFVDEQGEFVSPFADLPELPEDVNDAMEQLKLTILRHRAAGWEQFAKTDMLKVIAALQMLVNARG